MKKIMIAFMLALLLAGCSGSFDAHKMDSYIDKVETYSIGILVGENDFDDLKQVIDEYNSELKKIDTKDKDIKEFVDYQLEANKLRIEGIEKDDGELITESSKLQYFAIMKLQEIKGAE